VTEATADRPVPTDAGRREVADRITEEVLQLLYTAHQDLAEIGHAEGPADPTLVQSAQESTLGAISILRVIASSVLTAAWGPSDANPGQDPQWSRTSSLLFDAMSDAWLVTCTDRDLLYVSDAACALLGRTSDEVRALFRDTSAWPAELERLTRDATTERDTVMEIDVPLKDGEVRALRVVAHPLPAVPGVKRSYVSLLTER
jgi:PAS domain S-box-containing protein